MKREFFLLIAMLIQLCCYSQDSINIRGYYVIEYNKDEIEYKLKNEVLKKSGKPIVEVTDLEINYLFIPIVELENSLSESIINYKYFHKKSTYFLPQNPKLREYFRKYCGENFDFKKQSEPFKNSPIYYFNPSRPKFLYSIFYVEANGIKFSRENKKVNRRSFGLVEEEVSYDDFFSVLFLYHYTMVTDDFIRLEQFEKWVYKP